MYSQKHLDLIDVKKILDAAVAYAGSKDWAVSVAVVDSGGYLLGSLRMNGASALSSGISIEKAKLAAVGQKKTKVFEDMINQGRIAFLSVPGNVFLEGGINIIADGMTIGAVGVSGVKSEQDAEIAQVGIDSLN